MCRVKMYLSEREKIKLENPWNRGSVKISSTCVMVIRHLDSNKIESFLVILINDMPRLGFGRSIQIASRRNWSCDVFKDITQKQATNLRPNLVQL